MGVMIIILAIICVIATVLFTYLILAIKNKPELARYVEMIGYLLLIISLLWGFFVSETVDMANRQNDMVLNQKLNMLWDIESKESRNMEGSSNLDLYQWHSERNSNWYFLDQSGSRVKQQEETANRTQYFIVGLSTIFIASGRMSEILIYRRKKQVVVKGVYRNSRKRRGNIK